jgi:hypothetical protein
MCRTAFIFFREVFVMGRKQQRQEQGIFKHNDPDVKLADFSYQNDDVANLIVRCWKNDQGVGDDLVGNNTGMAQRKAAAKRELGRLPNRPFNLASAIVLTEDEYNAGWEQDDPDQVVFVLPNKSRQTGELLESAKMLMACVPNGI